jgi:hypothetical protein
MLSQELVDTWLMCNLGIHDKAEIRKRAFDFILSKSYENVLDKENPDELIFSEDLILKYHALGILSTHFPSPKTSYNECKVKRIRGEQIIVEDIKTNEEIVFTVHRNLNFFSAIRIVEFFEQGKIG